MRQKSKNCSSPKAVALSRIERDEPLENNVRLRSGEQSKYPMLVPNDHVRYGDSPKNFKYDHGSDTWQDRGAYLIIIWSNGYSVEKYRLPDKVLPGRPEAGKKENGRCFAVR